MVIAIDCSSRLNEKKALALKNAGVKFVIRYLGDSSSWKAMLLDEAEAIQQAGLKIISVFETNPTKRSYFTDIEAQQDAKNAAKHAQSINQPSGTIIYFTVDYNATKGDLATITSYFDKLVDSLECYEVGAYGSYYAEEYLKAHSKVRHFFQTYAWSGGSVEADSEVYQYLNGQNLSGISVDFDKVNDPAVAWVPVEKISVTMPTALGYVTKEAAKTVVVAATSKPPTSTVWFNYEIKPGDTLSKLAVDHNTTVDELASKNGIDDPGRIFAGQIIKVPVQGVQTAPAPKAPETHIEWVSHHVVSGDALSKFEVPGVDADAIAKHNGIDNPDKIYVGQTIEIPKVVSGSDHEFHTVASGENLSTISVHYGFSLQAIEGLNPSIEGPDYVIQPGEKVRVK